MSPIVINISTSRYSFSKMSIFPTSKISSASSTVSGRISLGLLRSSENVINYETSEGNRKRVSAILPQPLGDTENSENSPRVYRQATRRLKMRHSWSKFREFVTSSKTSISCCSSLRSKCSPLPILIWANKEDMWRHLCRKESGMYRRLPSELILSRHPALQARMRSILLEWLIEVCEVYRMHRETYYLAVDFIDRYLGVTNAQPKTSLQLIGVTCLFAAAKIEEIYPPKLTEFAYVTDGACTESEIIDMELEILKGLNWGLSPVTPNQWMRMFLQLIACDVSSENTNFLASQFSGVAFSRNMQLLDLVSLDMGSLSFSYSQLATSALCLYSDRQTALSVSGYTWHEVRHCVEWMTPFASTLQDAQANGSLQLQTKIFTNVTMEKQHNIQRHCINLDLLDQAQSPATADVSYATLKAVQPSCISAVTIST